MGSTVSNAKKFAAKSLESDRGRLGFIILSLTNGIGCRVVGPCHHGMARPQVADRGTASFMEGSCE